MFYNVNANSDEIRENERIFSKNTPASEIYHQINNTLFRIRPDINANGLFFEKKNMAGGKWITLGCFTASTTKPEYYYTNFANGRFDMYRVTGMETTYDANYVSRINMEAHFAKEHFDEEKYAFEGHNLDFFDIFHCYTKEEEEEINKMERVDSVSKFIHGIEKDPEISYYQYVDDLVYRLFWHNEFYHDAFGLLTKANEYKNGRYHYSDIAKKIGEISSIEYADSPYAGEIFFSKNWYYPNEAETDEFVKKSGFNVRTTELPEESEIITLMEKNGMPANPVPLNRYMKYCLAKDDNGFNILENGDPDKMDVRADCFYITSAIFRPMSEDKNKKIWNDRLHIMIKFNDDASCDISLFGWDGIIDTIKIGG